MNMFQWNGNNLHDKYSYSLLKSQSFELFEKIQKRRSKSLLFNHKSSKLSFTHSDLIFNSEYNLFHCSLFCRPCGWDKEKKISILYENMTTVKPDDSFEDVIVKPVLRKVSKIMLRSN